jgi:putative nucleotidyltransferase with HDIG domain
LLRSIVLTAEVYARFPVSPFMAERLEAMQQHASVVARIASSLEPTAAWKDDAFTAGLLHDIGKLLLAAHLPDVHSSIVREAERTHRLEHEVEVQRLGVHHGTLGACLLGMWGLPSVILEAAHAHHEPMAILPQPLTPVLAVTVADRLAHEISPLAAPNAVPALLPLAIRSDPRWPAWHDLAAQCAGPQADAA